MLQTLYYLQGCSRGSQQGQGVEADLQMSHGHSLLGISQGTSELSIEVRCVVKSLSTQHQVSS